MADAQLRGHLERPQVARKAAHDSASNGTRTNADRTERAHPGRCAEALELRGIARLRRSAREPAVDQIAGEGEDRKVEYSIDADGYA